MSKNETIGLNNNFLNETVKEWCFQWNYWLDSDFPCETIA